MNEKYFKGVTCGRCHTNLRYKKGKGCVTCARNKYTPKLGRRTKKEGSYYERNRETCLARTKAYQARRREYTMWQAAKQRARKKGQEFTLTLEDIKIPLICPVFQIPMKSPSIDRIDNSKGYTPDNIQVISNRANILKRDATIEELEAVVRYMKRP